MLQNARDLQIDRSSVKEVILTHNDRDHVSGLMTLRREMMKTNPSALSVVHVARGIFYSRPSQKGEENTMIALEKRVRSDWREVRSTRRGRGDLSRCVANRPSAP